MIVTTWKNIIVVWKYQIIIYLIDILLYKPDYYNLKVKSNLCMASKIFIIFSHNLIVFHSFSKKTKHNKSKKLINKLYMWRLIKNYNNLNYNSPELAFKVFKIPPSSKWTQMCPLSWKLLKYPTHCKCPLSSWRHPKHFVPGFLCTLAHDYVLLPKASNYVLLSETPTPPFTDFYTNGKCSINIP